MRRLSPRRHRHQSLTNLCEQCRAAGALATYSQPAQRRPVVSFGRTRYTKRPVGAPASNLTYPGRAVCAYDDAHGRHTALATITSSARASSVAGAA
jgi:hypothetical protein